ncbi:hypothetical protein L9F63_022651 [Diploptera punctata]|uniref:Ionotropic glutamate receptor L-glutamate and glycine-binding domain-containing protein n=1 Tax=Diploptera punctata TaxID=6984 RepID=A0AAD7ZM29_DIPPU|nr:hypothetical protein L9F63_022651 [Diploptera punctata]
MSDFVWLVFLESDSVEEIFEELNVPVDCVLLVAQREGTRVMLNEIYRLDRTLPPANVQQKKVSASSRFFDLIWQSLELDLNFTSKYYEVPNNSFGTLMKNGSWSGLMGMLQRREVQASNTAIMMSSSRVLAADFMVPVLDIKTFLVMRQPSSLVPGWNAYLQPLSSSVWCTVLATVLVISSLLSLTRHMNQPILLVLGVFCGQGHDVTDKPTSVRIVFLITYLTATVLLVCFSGSLIGHLTFQQPALPFTNFEEFLQDDTYDLGMIPRSAKLDYFKARLRRVCSDSYVHVIASHNLMGVTNVNCTITAVPDAFFPGFIAFAVPKRSSFLKLLNYRLTKILECGVLKALQHRFNYKFVKETSIDSHNSISCKEVAVLFVLLAAGISLSLLIFFLEIVYKKCQR